MTYHGTTTSPPASTTPELLSLYAILIGIDNYLYPELRLHGAVNDAKNLQRYLEEHLGVPGANITTLCDQQATRVNILQAIRSLADDSRIKQGDRLVVYYAGHGASGPSADPQDEYVDLKQKSQFLLPCDFGAGPFEDGLEIYGIPATTVNAVLRRVAATKGNNITMILDCSHTGPHMTNDFGNDDLVNRGVDLPFSVPDTIDEELLSYAAASWAMSLPHCFLSQGIQSHAVLTACNAEGVARECLSERYGLFTSALIHALQLYPTGQLPLESILPKLSIPGQTPCWQQPMCYPPSLDISRLIRFPWPWSFPQPISSLKKKQHIIPYGFGGQMGNEDLSSGWRHAVPRRERGMTLCYTYDDMSVELYQSVSRTKIRSPAIEHDWSEVSLDEKHRAQLHIILTIDTVYFEMNDAIFGLKGLSPTNWRRLPVRLDPIAENIVAAIMAATRAFNFLRRESAGSGLRSNIRFDFTKVRYSESEYDEWLVPLTIPEGPNLHKKDAITVYVDPSDSDAMYGAQLANTSSSGLYLAVLFFDNDFSVVSLHDSLIVKFLAPGETWTIGFGEDGGQPWTYVLQDDQMYDVGYLKIFVSARPMDLSCILQDSPFRNVGERRMQYPQPSEWHYDTLRIPLIQKRHSHTLTAQ